MDIKVLKAQGYSQRAVAKMLRVHRDTVRRVWDEGEPRSTGAARRSQSWTASRITCSRAWRATVVCGRRGSTVRSEGTVSRADTRR
jgi:hypothetical protein